MGLFAAVFNLQYFFSKWYILTRKRGHFLTCFLQTVPQVRK